MSIAYAQKNKNAVQTKRESSVSIIDTSSQSESLQRKADMANNAAQRAEAPRPNNTGMPDNLKSGIESLSGFSMDDVRVHYNSSKPATVQALAYTQGTDIHVAPGQEKHLPHEAWHVAQQMAGRVSPTTNINGMPVNDNAALEHEADVMGAKAVQCKIDNSVQIKYNQAQNNTLQRMCRIGKKTLIFASSKSNSSHDGGLSRSGLDSTLPVSSVVSAPIVWPSVGLDSSSNSSSSGFKDPVSTLTLHGPKADYMEGTQGNANILNGVRDSENSRRHNLAGKIADKNKWHFWNVGFYHAHFWFDKNYKLPYSGQEGTLGNNIGYGGHLYDDSEAFEKYDLSQPLFESYGLKDKDIKRAIWIHKNFGAYNPISNNCQHWVNTVINTAKEIKNAEAEFLNTEKTGQNDAHTELEQNDAHTELEQNDAHTELEQNDSHSELEQNDAHSEKQPE
jgi:hypothetical protein